MSSSPRGHRHTAKRLEIKHSLFRLGREECCAWIATLLGAEQLKVETLFEDLASGTVLLDVADTIAGKLLPRHGNAAAGTYWALDNLAHFLKWARKLGCEKHELFTPQMLSQPEDRVNLENQAKIVASIVAISRRAYEKYGIAPLVLAGGSSTHPLRRGKKKSKRRRRALPRQRIQSGSSLAGIAEGDSESESEDESSSSEESYSGSSGASDAEAQSEDELCRDAAFATLDLATPVAPAPLLPPPRNSIAVPAHLAIEQRRTTHLRGETLRAGVGGLRALVGGLVGAAKGVDTDLVLVRSTRDLRAAALPADLALLGRDLSEGVAGAGNGGVFATNQALIRKRRAEAAAAAAAAEATVTPALGTLSTRRASRRPSAIELINASLAQMAGVAGGAEAAAAAGIGIGSEGAAHGAAKSLARHKKPRPRSTSAPDKISTGRRTSEAVTLASAHSSLRRRRAKQRAADPWGEATGIAVTNGVERKHLRPRSRLLRMPGVSSSEEDEGEDEDDDDGGDTFDCALYGEVAAMGLQRGRDSTGLAEAESARRLLQAEREVSPVAQRERTRRQSIMSVRVLEAAFPYEAKMLDELSLSAGEQVKRLGPIEGGWCRCASLKTRKVGLVPSNFLAPVGTRKASRAVRRASLAVAQPQQQPQPQAQQQQQQQQRVAKKLQVLYDFGQVPRTPEEVAVLQHEVVTGISVEGAWYHVRTARGTEGVVPKSYVRELAPLVSALAAAPRPASPITAAAAPASAAARARAVDPWAAAVGEGSSGTFFAEAEEEGDEASDDAAYAPSATTYIDAAPRDSEPRFGGAGAARARARAQQQRQLAARSAAKARPKSWCLKSVLVGSRSPEKASTEELVTVVAYLRKLVNDPVKRALASDTMIRMVERDMGGPYGSSTPWREWIGRTVKQLRDEAASREDGLALSEETPFPRYYARNRDRVGRRVQHFLERNGMQGFVNCSTEKNTPQQYTMHFWGKLCTIKLKENGGLLIRVGGGYERLGDYLARRMALYTAAVRSFAEYQSELIVALDEDL